MFQFGDAFDLHLGLGPQAAAERDAAALGDVRLLFTQRGNEPTVMLYRYVDGPGGPPPGSGAPRPFTSPTGAEIVAEIRPLAGVRAVFVREKEGWNLEAAIPWKSLGVAAPTKATMLRGDLGVLESDPNGQTTIARYYWANKRVVPISDQPSEVRVLPGFVGRVRIHSRRRGGCAARQIARSRARKREAKKVGVVVRRSDRVWQTAAGEQVSDRFGSDDDAPAETPRQTRLRSFRIRFRFRRN